MLRHVEIPDGLHWLHGTYATNQGVDVTELLHGFADCTIVRAILHCPMSLNQNLPVIKIDSRQWHRLQQ
jgi:hypothetical protein